jgi:hypothetical protein
MCGPTAATIVRCRAPSGSRTATPRATRVTTVPFQPLWMAATAPLSRSASSMGTQSAERTPQATPRVRETVMSPCERRTSSQGLFCR